MTVIDQPLLAEIRAERCAWCGAPPPNEAAHVFAKGIGAGFRLDVPANVLPLCTYDHRRHHDGHSPTRDDLLAIAARRLKVLQPDLLAALYLLRRLPRLNVHRLPFEALEFYGLTDSQGQPTLAGRQAGVRPRVLQ